MTAPTALHVLDLLDDAATVVLVDAMRTAGAARSPGEVVRAESEADGLPVALRSSLSSHGLGLAEAVGLAAALGPVPRVVFLGVEVGDVVAGNGLSPAVDAALPALVEAIVHEAGAGTEDRDDDRRPKPAASRFGAWCRVWGSGRSSGGWRSGTA